MSMEISTNNTTSKLLEHQHWLIAMAPPEYTGHDTRYQQLANPATPKHRYLSTALQPPSIPSAFSKNHRSIHGKRVHFASGAADSQRKPRKTLSPAPRPDSPIHPASMSKLALKASAGASVRAGSTVPANTSRRIDPTPRRLPAPSHLTPTLANTSASRDKPSQSTHVLTERDHGTMRNSSTSSKSTYRPGSNTSTGFPRSLSPANISSRRASEPHRRPLNIPPAVPEAPRQGPPPTPRPARLLTPDLEDISQNNFCDCNNLACRGYEYLHDHQGKPLSKMSVQSTTHQVLLSKSADLSNSAGCPGVYERL